MKKLLITLYSNYMDAYDDPTISLHQEEDLFDLYKRTILSDPEGAYKAKAQDKTVCVLGVFDDCKGQLLAYENPKKLFDLAALFPKGFLLEKEAKKNA